MVKSGGPAVQAPVAGLHVPAVWQASTGAHVTEPVAVQTPLWQASPVVHASPSLHAVPSGRAGLEQAPVAGLQVPASWHGSDAVQTTGFEPVQTPAWQVSVCVHASPSLHDAPLGAFENEVIDSPGMHDWHGFPGLTVPGGKNTPPTEHPGAHCDPLHASPCAHATPHAPQFCGVVMFVSQPSSPSLLQSAVPAAQRTLNVTNSSGV